MRRFRATDFLAEGLIASPPCQTFSTAGNNAGVAALQLVFEVLADLAARRPVNPFIFDDERTALVLEPLRWALEALDADEPYRWIALEQVPAVLPVWQAIAEVLRSEGYGVVTGLLRAEAYGVPQTRKRAFLLAAYGAQVAMPAATHSRFHPTSPAQLDEGVKPWISMAQALGWGLVRRPSYAIPAGGTRGSYSGHEWGSLKVRNKLFAALESGDEDLWLPRPWQEELVNGHPRVRDQSGVEVDLEWPHNRPSTAVLGRDLIQHPGGTRNRTAPRAKSRNDGIRVTPAEAALLQTFPPELDFAGSGIKQYQQIGNAIPPLLARVLLATAEDAALSAA